MQHMANQHTLPFRDALRKALPLDLVDVEAGVRFPCRPLSAHSGEKHTAYGKFTGQIALANMHEFSAAMRNLATERIAKVILDFSEVTLSKTAVGVLVGFAAAMHGRNKRLYLFQASAQVKTVLKELKLMRYFSFLETEEDILATLVV